MEVKVEVEVNGGVEVVVRIIGFPLHTMATSSLCTQLWLPMPLWLQDRSVSSPKLQSTSSSQIGTESLAEEMLQIWGEEEHVLKFILLT